MENVKWKVENEKWKMKNGKCKVKNVEILNAKFHRKLKESR